MNPSLLLLNNIKFELLPTLLAHSKWHIKSFSCYFNSKEPDPEPVIKQFAEGYGVQFDMFSKINVNGSNALPVFKYLKSQLKGTLGR